MKLKKNSLNFPGEEKPDFLNTAYILNGFQKMTQ